MHPTLNIAVRAARSAGTTPAASAEITLIATAATSTYVSVFIEDP